MKRININKIAVAGFAALALVFIYYFHANRRPFRPTDDFTAKAKINNESVDADVFKPVGIRDVYYVRLNRASDKRYPWIVFSSNYRLIADPIGVYDSWLGYTYTHADQATGISLTDPKLEDNWTVEHDDHRIDLANTEIQIQINRQKR